LKKAYLFLLTVLQKETTIESEKTQLKRQIETRFMLRNAILPSDNSFQPQERFLLARSKVKGIMRSYYFLHLRQQVLLQTVHQSCWTTVITTTTTSSDSFPLSVFA
jgi:hypothetical protein